MNQSQLKGDILGWPLVRRAFMATKPRLLRNSVRLCVQGVVIEATDHVIVELK
jgi:hypothetical protein